MSGLADGLSMFCEHCGAHRDQVELAGSMRACPMCAQAVCPNCWNLTADACLACVPFALVETPPKSGRPRKAAAAAVAGTASQPDGAPATFDSPATTAPSSAPSSAPSKGSRRLGRKAATTAGAAAPPPTPTWPTVPTGPLMFPPDAADAPVRGSVAPGRSRASRHASRALVRLGLATVAASMVAAGAVAFTLASWSGDRGPAIVDAGGVMSPAPVAPEVATPSPTRKPKPKPTHKPTAKPRATPRPTPKPKPTHRPTPKPTRQPTPKPPPLVAFLSCSVSDLTVSCTGDASRSGARFTWRFGDGARAAGEIASHIYAEPGVYSIDLTVTVGGDKASDSTSATVTAP